MLILFIDPKVIKKPYVVKSSKEISWIRRYMAGVRVILESAVHLWECWRVKEVIFKMQAMIRMPAYSSRIRNPRISAPNCISSVSARRSERRSRAKEAMAKISVAGWRRGLRLRNLQPPLFNEQQTNPLALPSSHNGGSQSWTILGQIEATEIFSHWNEKEFPNEVIKRRFFYSAPFSSS